MAILMQRQEIELDLRPRIRNQIRQCHDVVDAVKERSRVVVVELVFLNEHGANEEEIDGVVGNGYREPGAVKRPANVAPIIRADEPLGAVDKLLPAESQERIGVGVV